LTPAAEPTTRRRVSNQHEYQADGDTGRGGARRASGKSRDAAEASVRAPTRFLRTAHPKSLFETEVKDKFRTLRQGLAGLRRRVQREQRLQERELDMMRFLDWRVSQNSERTMDSKCLVLEIICCSQGGFLLLEAHALFPGGLMFLFSFIFL